MVRLVFRPYTQVGRPICTSGPLRASTRVSSGFALPRHSSPSFGSYRTRSRSTSLTEQARRAGGAPGPERPGSHLGPKGPSLSLRHGVSSDPLTRACVRLLGPCFKTGRVGCRHRRRPLVSFREPIPTLATRGARVRTENSPTRLTPRRGRGAPRASSRHSGHFVLGPRKRRGWSRGAVKNRTEVLFHLRPQPFQADPEPVAAHHRRRKCARRRPSPTGTGSPEGDPRAPERPTLVRVESSGQTARTPPVYLLTVSRPLELSLQSSFQLSLKVLVDYRSHASI